MGQNFDDDSGFHQIPGMPILLQHSVDILGTSYYSEKSLGVLKSETCY
jgi:hypothetical protein